MSCCDLFYVPCRYIHSLQIKSPKLTLCVHCYSLTGLSYFMLGLHKEAHVCDSCVCHRNECRDKQQVSNIC